MNSKSDGYGSDNTANGLYSIKKTDITNLGKVGYIDEQNNVYNPEDILSNKLNPQVIAKWQKNEKNEYSIPQFKI